MAKKFSRLWSIAAVCLVFFIILASLNVLRPATSTPSIAPEIDKLQAEVPEQKDADQLQTETTPFEDTESTPTASATVPSSAVEDVLESTVPIKSPPPPPPPPPPARPDAAEPSDPSLPHDPFHPLDEAPHPGVLPNPAAENTNETPTGNATEKEETPGPATVVSTPTEEPTPTGTSKTLVMGRMKSEDTEWVGSKLSDWENAIYYVDLPQNETSPSGLRTSMNKAREAMPYLTYIIDNYDNFSDVNVFMHPHRMGMPQAWHNDARQHDAVHMINDLKLETVLDRGYVNLRCNNEVGCPEEIHPFRDPPLKEKDAEHAYPFFYSYFFNTTIDQMKEQIPVVATQCCAQFAVSKAELLKRPKQDYERYRTFLEETPYDDQTSGRVMEYMWHIIFGRDAVHCENVFECWCAVYGRCTGVNRHRPPI